MPPQKCFYLFYNFFSWICTGILCSYNIVTTSLLECLHCVDSLYSNKGAATGGTNASKIPMENNREQRSAANVNKGNSFDGTVKLDQRLFPSINDHNYTKTRDYKSQPIIQQNCVNENIQTKSTGLFVGKLFRFSNTFPEDRVSFSV